MANFTDLIVVPNGPVFFAGFPDLSNTYPSAAILPNAPVFLFGYPDDISAFADLTGPSLVSFSPEGEIEPDFAFEIQAFDAKQITYARVDVETADGLELAYARDTGFSSNYSGTPTSTATSLGLVFSRVGGLPFGQVVVRLFVVDRGGNVLQEERAYTVPGEYPAPEVVGLTPLPSSVIAVDQEISFRIEGDAPLVQTQLIVTASGRTEIVLDSTLGQSDSYEYTTATPDAQTLEISGLRRIAGWRGDVFLTINARDDRGRTLATQFYFQGEGASEALPPYVYNVEPANKQLYKNTTIGFTVLHPSGRDEIVWLSVTANFAQAGIWEVVWQGGEFGPYYESKSLLSRSAGAFQFEIRRHTGWPSSPEFTIAGVDREGQLIQELVGFPGGG